MFQEIQIENLKKAPWNYKVEDAELQAKLEENIKRNGQLETVLVRSLGDGLYEVINGNHRLSAFQNAGIQKVMCYVVDGLSVEKAKRLAIELNETRFKADPKKMAELMAGLLLEYTAEDLGDTMPFSKTQLESYIPDTIDWGEFSTPDVDPVDIDMGASAVPEDVKLERKSKGEDYTTRKLFLTEEEKGILNKFVHKYSKKATRPERLVIEEMDKRLGITRKRLSTVVNEFTSSLGVQ